MVNKLGFGVKEIKAAKGMQKIKSEVKFIVTTSCLFSPHYIAFQGYMKLADLKIAFTVHVTSY